MKDCYNTWYVYFKWVPCHSVVVFLLWVEKIASRYRERLHKYLWLLWRFSPQAWVLSMLKFPTEISMLWHVGWVLWKWPKQQKIDIRFSVSGLLKTGAWELAQYISVVIQVRWVKNGTEPAVDYTFSVEMRMSVTI